MESDPTGFFLGLRSARRGAYSAFPDAPVVPDKPRRPRRPRRPPRTTSLRTATAVSLRSLAAWIEPRLEDEPCTSALPGSARRARF